MSAKGDRPVRRQRDAGSYSHGIECPVEMQRGNGHRLFEGQERSSDTSASAENKGNIVRPDVLGQWVLCKHSRSGRRSDTAIRQRPRKATKRPRTTGV